MDINAQKSAGPELPEGITAEQMDRHLKRQEGIMRAQMDAVPGPLADAFAGDVPKFCGLTLREVVPTDLGLLKRLDSPLHREMLQLAKPVEERVSPEFADEDVWELLYLFTRPARAARATLAMGRPQFREAALAFADALPPEAIGRRAELMAIVSQLWLRAFSTLVEHAPPPSADGSFPPPPPTTASAGGSVSCAG